MFVVELFTDNTWIIISSHSLLKDAESQKQRFIDFGTNEICLRIQEI